MFQTVPLAGAYAKDPSEMAFDLVAHVLLGIYLWEWFISLDFDWQYISQQRPFRWPLTFYFMNRYFMLFSLFGIIIGVEVISKIDCQSLYHWNTVVGASSIGLASINLSLRTIAVWSRSWYIITPLIVLILGHFGLLLHVVTISGMWVPGKGCITTYASGPVLMATYIYTMCFDFIILSLMTIKLYQSSIPGAHSRLSNLIFKDGLIYFIIVFLMNVVATTIISLHRNPAISVITSPPSAVMSTIVACRVVRRLNNYSLSGPLSTQPSNTHVSPLAFHSQRSNVSTFGADGIRVQTSLSEAQTQETRSTEIFAMENKDGYDRELQTLHRRATGSPP